MAYQNPAAGAVRERGRATEESALFTAIPAAAVADVATADADGTYGAPEATLINELKTQLNTTLARMRTVGILAAS